MGKQMKTKIHIPFVVAPLFLAFVRWGPWGGWWDAKENRNSNANKYGKIGKGRNIHKHRKIYIYIHIKNDVKTTLSKHRQNNNNHKDHL